MNEEIDLLVVDASGRIIGCSPAMAARLGVAPAMVAPGAALDALRALLPAGLALRARPLGPGLVAHIVEQAPPEADEAAALRAENAMLRETLDSLDASVVVYDSDLRYRFGNSVYHAMFPHLPPDRELAGETYAQVLGRSIDAGTVADPQAATDRAGFIARREQEVRDRNLGPYALRGPGDDRVFQIRANWTPSGNRVSLRIDTTETDRLHQELLRAQRMETIARLSGGVAHDFNNLLTVIIGNLELIQMKKADLPPPHAADVDALSQSALAAAEAGARLTHELLTFARREVTQPVLLDPAALVEGMTDLLRRAVGPGIDLHVVATHGGRAVRCDTVQLEAALMNLAMNSYEAICRARATQPGSPGDITITIAADEAEEDGHVLISVADRGCGMPPEVVAQAFEPFFTTKRAGEGSGLGLSQVHGFVHAAGGDVRVDSTPGVGTTVTMRLRAAHPAAAVAAPLARPAPGAGNPVAPLRDDGATILMVEDDPDVLATTARAIGNLGYRLTTAATGDEAMRRLREDPTIRLLFTDIVMPASTLNGVELARLATRERPDLKVLLTTGYSANALDAEVAGAVNILLKPYRFADLAARLQALIEAPAAISA